MATIDELFVEIIRKPFRFHPLTILDDGGSLLEFDGNPNDIASDTMDAGRKKLYDMPPLQTEYINNAGKVWLKTEAPNTWVQAGAGSSVAMVEQPTISMAGSVADLSPFQSAYDSIVSEQGCEYKVTDANGVQIEDWKSIELTAGATWNVKSWSGWETYSGNNFEATVYVWGRQKTTYNGTDYWSEWSPSVVYITPPDESVRFISDSEGALFEADIATSDVSHVAYPSYDTTPAEIEHCTVWYNELTFDVNVRISFEVTFAFRIYTINISPMPTYGLRVFFYRDQVSGDSQSVGYLDLPGYFMQYNNSFFYSISHTFSNLIFDNGDKLRILASAVNFSRYINNDGSGFQIKQTSFKITAADILL